MISVENSKNYFYLGMGVIGILILSGLALVNAVAPRFTPATGLVLLSVQTPRAQYQTQISERQLFSREPASVFFSSIGDTPEESIMECTINCSLK